MKEVNKPVVIIRKKTDEDKMSGYDISQKLHEMLVELDGISEFDEEELGAWHRKFSDLLECAEDKMYAYRKAISIAKSREEFFKNERDRYVKKARQQAGVQDRVKQLATMLAERHYESTGEKKMSMKDGTSASYVLRDSYKFELASQPGVAITAYDLPTEFLKEPVIDVAKLKRAAKKGYKIPEVTTVTVKKGHVRWS